MKVRYRTGGEVFVVILRRVNEDAFLSFASIGPYFVTEDNDEAEAMIDEYFPEGAEDVHLEDVEEEEEEVDEEEEVEEEEELDVKDDEEIVDIAAMYTFL